MRAEDVLDIGLRGVGCDALSQILSEFTGGVAAPFGAAGFGPAFRGAAGAVAGLLRQRVGEFGIVAVRGDVVEAVFA